MNPILKSLYDRKSIRSYCDKAISPEDKNAILEAAFQAPTAGNQQLYTILDVTDPKIKADLAKSCDHQPFIASAPMVLVFLADCLKWWDAYRASGIEARKPGVGDLMLAVADSCIAAQNAVIAAESLGIGSCYIGDIMENAEALRALLCLPNGVFPCLMAVFGYPTSQQRERHKPKRFPPSFMVQENLYRQPSPQEWKAALTQRAEDSATPSGAPFDAESWIRAFCKRKYESDFSQEMTRSVEVYLRDFLHNGDNP